MVFFKTRKFEEKKILCAIILLLAIHRGLGALKIGLSSQMVINLIIRNDGHKQVFTTCSTKCLSENTPKMPRFILSLAIIIALLSHLL